VNTFRNAKFTIVYSQPSSTEYGSESTFNLKDEGVDIEKVYVNEGFAEYQHDIGNNDFNHIISMLI
jgi:hypothetical protein